MYDVDVDKWDNYIIRSGSKYTWDEAVAELTRLHKVRSYLWQDYN